VTGPVNRRHVDFDPPMNGWGHERRARNMPPADRYISDPYVRRLLAEWDAWLIEQARAKEAAGG
jgi:hypothetical protein